MINHYLAMGHLQLMLREQIVYIVAELNDTHIVTYPSFRSNESALFSSGFVITDDHANVGIHPKPEKSDSLLGIHNIRLSYFSQAPEKVSRADQLTQIIRNHFLQQVGTQLKGEFGTLEVLDNREPAHDARNCFWSIGVAYVFSQNVSQ